ncbi:MAG: MarR family transcriptional regulator [Nocardioidaceae bacterium]|nr:MAG: MarR family transcriptional regulator [Nocardioidaceae bacterium]
MPTVEKVTRTRAGLASELRFAVAKINRRLRSERDPHNELSMARLSVLAVLFREGDQTVGQLAEFERVKPPSMTRLVNALEEEGYVTRCAAADDGRQIIVSLAELGEETILADRRRRDAWLAQQLSALSAEERAILRQAAPILSKLGNC